MKATLFLSEHCNRKCSYCDVARIEEPRTADVDTLRATCSLINEFIKPTSVTITGGEPGVLSAEFFDSVFISFRKATISVNTNGTLLKRGLHKRYSFDSILYHPFEEIGDDFEVYDDERITYHFPVHAGNIKEVPRFVQMHKDIEWDFAIYDDKAGKPGLIPDEDTIMAFAQVMERIDNVTDHTRKAMNRITRTLKFRDKMTRMCRMGVWEPSFNLVDMTIQPCVCSHTRVKGVPLTKDNLWRMAKDPNDVFETMDSPLCKTCLHPLTSFLELSKVRVGNGKKG